MNQLILLLTITSASLALPPQLILAQWNSFKVQHNKNYESPDEEVLRMQIFQDNLKKIEEHNELFRQGLETYEMGINQFADVTDKEFEDFLSLSGPPPSINETNDIYEAPGNLSVPASIDYRTKHAVNGVKNQGSCGSCWAFSAVGALESIYFLKKKKLYSLSEQNLLDCSGSYGNKGCNGGIMGRAYDYIKDHGIETENGYPYRARVGRCVFSKNKSVIKIKGHSCVARGSETSLQSKVATVGPVSVAVDATKWKSYKSGIFSTSGGYRLNHGVVVIGYGAQKDKKYYIVRNSWGTGWGENGYIRVARDKRNQVGISDQACYPNI